MENLIDYNALREKLEAYIENQNQISKPKNEEHNIKQ